MSTRLDVAIKKHPEHEEGLRLLASRDPSGKLKYLDWSGKVLASGQALAPEIADVIELFHRFNGRSFGPRLRVQRIRTDIHTYRPQELSSLRDNLLKIQRAQNRKIRKRERLYRIEGALDADVIYDSPDLIVRHIKNKQASVHYGHGTKWCISMLREGYFEDYEVHNATFFFFERKTPKKDEFDKLAIVVPRGDGEEGDISAFTALDERTGTMTVAKVYGSRVFAILREISERSARYPGSVLSQVYRGCAHGDGLVATLALVVAGGFWRAETDRVLQTICCNDAAPWSLLETIANRARSLSAGARKGRGSRRMHSRRTEPAGVERAVKAAIAIHPNTPDEARERFMKELRRRRVDTDSIRRTDDGSTVGVAYEVLGNRSVHYRGAYRGYRRGPRRQLTVSRLRARARGHARAAMRYRKKAGALQKKQRAAAARLKAAAAKKKRRDR